VANLERNKAGSGAGDLAAMETIEVVDELTFTITFNRPAGAWPAILADRAGSIASPAAFGEALDLQPVGAGMYQGRGVRQGRSHHLRAL
jgi:ABC-type transport system substrate-binding protein